MNPIQKMLEEAAEAASNRQRTKAIFSAEKIAEVAHGAVRAFQAVFPTCRMEPPWGDLEPERRSARVQMARHVVNHVESTGGVPEIDFHEKELAWHLRNGWRFGPTYSEELKQSPLLLPWFEIQGHERMVGFLFHTVVAQMAIAQTSMPVDGESDA